ncbi:hypothetical protein [Noviherbaspirillum sp. UKPF54]|uniref:hypothetical protein n=1 Tax=Noviherbaspirillum sp. UKPF54 TaxID=2601898 RepID=UPI0011B188F8|nr:hypothetical protein [Noviherbaspirillum sp. UKPF54]QDZ26560.1 hypothetical protein FAY22_00405 [Noviherbaspirillum sp. UKPF54]
MKLNKNMTFDEAVEQLRNLPDPATKLDACPKASQDKLAGYAQNAVDLFKSGEFYRAMLELDRVHALTRLLAQSLEKHDTPEQAVAAIDEDLGDIEGNLLTLFDISNHYDEHPAFKLA